MRSTARETVFKFIYSQLFNPSDEELFARLKKGDGLNSDESEFANSLLQYVQNDKENFEKLIQDYSVGFKLNRIFAADKCAIFIGMAELKNFAETPTPVIIDEAVKLAAKFSTEKSTDFVNGILARYAKEINRG